MMEEFNDSQADYRNRISGKGRGTAHFWTGWPWVTPADGGRTGRGRLLTRSRIFGRARTSDCLPFFLISL